MSDAYQANLYFPFKGKEVAAEANFVVHNTSEEVSCCHCSEPAIYTGIEVIRITINDVETIDVSSSFAQEVIAYLEEKFWQKKPACSNCYWDVVNELQRQ